MVTSFSQSSQSVRQYNEDEEGEEEGASVQQEHISSSTVVNATDTLMCYFEQCHIGVSLICRSQNNDNSHKVNSCKNGNNVTIMLRSGWIGRMRLAERRILWIAGELWRIGA